MLRFPRLEYLREGHVVTLVQRASCETVYGLQSGGLGLIVSYDGFVLRGHPGPPPAPLELVYRACPVGTLQDLAGLPALPGSAVGAELPVLRQLRLAFAALHNITLPTKMVAKQPGRVYTDLVTR